MIVALPYLPYQSWPLLKHDGGGRGTPMHGRIMTLFLLINCKHFWNFMAEEKYQNLRKIKIKLKLSLCLIKSHTMNASLVKHMDNFTFLSLP
jgi:hypothetical protein